jgi:hypothetical protein
VYADSQVWAVKERDGSSQCFRQQYNPAQKNDWGKMRTGSRDDGEGKLVKERGSRGSELKRGRTTGHEE